MVIGGNEPLRNLVYLGFVNVAGMVICHSLENRERTLYTQRLELEAARSDARERAAAAEEANREKTRLIAAVSHDLRQPMTAAVAHLDVLRSRLERGDLDGARVQAGRAEGAVGILGATLDHLLTAARYDSGTEAIKIEMLELAPLLRELREAYIPHAAARGIELRFRVPRRRMLANTDGRSLYRVLSNLVSNAIKFTDRRPDGGGGVIVRARVVGDRCRIDVVDTGVGIAPENLAAIWQPYVQINNAERNRERGLGLGLFLVRRIVDQLPGHSISMTSRFGRGSRFRVEFPGTMLSDALVSPLREEPVQLAPLDLSDLAGAYVLLVEDDHEARLSILELLNEWGVLYASGHTETALREDEAGSERLVDAIICDYRLPGGVTGVDSIARIRDRLGYAPAAVLITGESDVNVVRSRAGPNTVVLHKPFPARALALPLLEAVRTARRAESE
jgi:signal transduction histidine kinase/CheY-like chemotaxis protein